jgi:hypothetical protein
MFEEVRKSQRRKYDYAERRDVNSGGEIPRNKGRDREDFLTAPASPTLIQNSYCL